MIQWASVAINALWSMFAGVVLIRSLLDGDMALAAVSCVAMVTSFVLSALGLKRISERL